MAVYPFWGTVAETVGRLLRLQKDVGAAQVQRRIREQFGERETVARAARRVLRSFIDWGVLVEGSNKGVYRSAGPQGLKPKLQPLGAVLDVLVELARQTVKKGRADALGAIEEMDACQWMDDWKQELARDRRADGVAESAVDNG